MRVSSFLFRALPYLAGLTVALALTNGTLALLNQSLQQEVRQRQGFINENARFVQLDQNLIRALATVAETRKDDAVKDLLARHGVTFSAPSAAPPSAAAPAPPEAKPSTAGKAP